MKTRVTKVFSNEHVQVWEQYAIHGISEGVPDVPTELLRTVIFRKYRDGKEFILSVDISLEFDSRYFTEQRYGVESHCLKMFSELSEMYVEELINVLISFEL